MNVKSVRNTYSPKLRLLALVVLGPWLKAALSGVRRSVIWVPLVGDLLRIPLINRLSIRVKG